MLTAFSQWGWGTDAFGLGQAGPVEAFLPVVTLAILFGLSIRARALGGPGFPRVGTSGRSA